MPLRLASGFTPYLSSRTLIFLVWSLRLCLHHIPPPVLSYCFTMLMTSYRNHPISQATPSDTKVTKHHLSKLKPSHFSFHLAEAPRCHKRLKPPNLSTW